MKFVGGSTQRIEMASPFTTAIPYTVGMWHYPTTSGNNTLFSMGATGSTNAASVVIQSGTPNDMTFSYFAGVPQTFNIASTIIYNDWNFVVCRHIAAANRRMSTLSGGKVLHASNTTSISHSGIVKWCIGATDHSSVTIPYFGHIAEFFFCDRDIDPSGSGGALSDEFVRQLAYQGPWSFLHLQGAILEYRQLRRVTESSTDRASAGEVYQRNGQRAWVAGGTGPFDPGYIPPLYGNYVRPTQIPNLIVC